MKLMIFGLSLIVICSVCIGCSSQNSSNQSQAKPNVLGGEDNRLPPYEEIKAEVWKLTKRDENPEGPEVGLDGLIDPSIGEAVAAYRDTLIGKEVHNWQGWYYGYTGPLPDNTYNVAILLQPPQPDVRYFSEVLLVGLSGEQTLGLDSVEIGHEVMFSGSLLDVNIAARITLANTTFSLK
jgi:hypothetical protein